VQTIHKPQDAKMQHFAKMQEGPRKDMERCLRSYMLILPSHSNYGKWIQIYKVMFACVRLHIMVIEDEEDSNIEFVKKS
jgi:hypothetical protein